MLKDIMSVLVYSLLITTQIINLVLAIKLLHTPTVMINPLEEKSLIIADDRNYGETS